MSQVPEKTRDYLAYVAERARNGHTGRIIMDFNQGGITNFEEIDKPTVDEVRRRTEVLRGNE